MSYAKIKQNFLYEKDTLIEQSILQIMQTYFNTKIFIFILCVCMCFIGPKLNSDTQAALKAFNAYRPQLQALDAPEVGKQLISYGLLRKGGTHSGEAIHLPNELKMTFSLPEIEQNISLNGPKVLLLLVTALSEIPSCAELSIQLNGMYVRGFFNNIMHMLCTYVHMCVYVCMYVRYCSDATSHS